MSTQVADILDAAADWLEPRQWVQGQLYLRDGDRFSEIIGGCAIGAIDAVCDGPAPLLVKVVQALRRSLPDRGAISVTTWQDVPGRTKVQVLDAMRIAANEQRAKPDPGDSDLEILT